MGSGHGLGRSLHRFLFVLWTGSCTLKLTSLLLSALPPDPLRLFPSFPDYFSFRTNLTFPSQQSQITYYSVYQTCATSTLFGDRVFAAANGMCAAVWFVEAFLIMALVTACFGYVLHIMSDKRALVSLNLLLQNDKT